MRNRKVVRLNESQLRTLVRGMMTEDSGEKPVEDSGTVAEVSANQFFDYRNAMEVLKKAGFLVKEEDKVPNPSSRYLNVAGDAARYSSRFHDRLPVFIISRQDQTPFTKSEVMSLMKGAGEIKKDATIFDFKFL